MTTIRLDIDIPDYPEPVSYNLALPNDDYQFERHYHFVATELIHCGRSEVFRGKISRDDCAKEVVVICKLVRGNLTRLRREAKFYTGPLKPLQGIHVPRFHGLYVGRHTEDDINFPVACIILQDCGNWITPKARGTLKAITRVMKALVAIHRAGVEHNDFYDNDFRHVVVSPDNPLAIRIVDFDNASPHECRAKPIEIWGYEPPPGSFGCYELYDVGYAIGAWTPVLISCIGRTYTIFRAATIARLALLLQHDGGNKEVSEEERQFYWDKAREFFTEYYGAYARRFRTIRHPLEFNEPLGIEGVDEEPPFVEYDGVHPWEKPEWKQWREELAKDKSKGLPVV